MVDIVIYNKREREHFGISTILCTKHYKNVFNMVKYQNRSVININYRQSQCEGFKCRKFLQHIRHVDDIVTCTLKRDCVNILREKKKTKKRRKKAC